MLPPGLGIYVDIKNSVDDALCSIQETTASKVARIIAPVGEERSVLLTSFDPSVAALVRATAPNIATGLSTWEQIPLRESIPSAHHLGFEVLAPYIGAVKPYGIPLGADSSTLRAHVEIAHEAGLQVLVWVVDPDDLPYLRDLDVDAACVDDIPAAQARLK
jgi:glycerophosphoryl diester phosphodiesterase